MARLKSRWNREEDEVDLGLRARAKTLGALGVGALGTVAAAKLGLLPLGSARAVGFGGNSFQIPPVTSDPFGAPAGSLWYRSDTGQMSYPDGISGLNLRLNEWGSFFGKPALVVSPVGTAQGQARKNAGADFGPDTTSTQSVGIVEMLAASNGTIPGRLLPGTFTTSVPINLTTATSLEGSGPNTILKPNYVGDAIHLNQFALASSWVGRFTIDGSLQPTGTGFHVTDTVGYDFYSLRVVNYTGGTGILVDSSSHYCENDTFYNPFVFNCLTGVKYTGAVGRNNWYGGQVSGSGLTSGTGILLTGMTNDDSNEFHGTHVGGYGAGSFGFDWEAGGQTGGTPTYFYGIVFDTIPTAIKLNQPNCHLYIFGATYTGVSTPRSLVAYGSLIELSESQYLVSTPTTFLNGVLTGMTGNVTGQTTNQTVFSTTVGATGLYNALTILHVTAYTAGTFNVTYDWWDESNTHQTTINQRGFFVPTGANQIGVTATGTFITTDPLWIFGGTVLTVAVSAGTGTYSAISAVERKA